MIVPIYNKQHSVYLAGPITGLSYEGCTDWRQYIMDNLPPQIIGFSPLRAKDYLQEEVFVKDAYNESLGRMAEILSSQRGIFARDMNDCRVHDLIIANFLGAERVSIGTVMEITAFWWEKKPIILIMEDEGNPHDHAMIREASPFRVRTLDEAIFVASTVLLPVGH